jgi:site-specific recombinase XerD
MSGSVTGQTVELFKRHHGAGESRADWKKSNPEFGKMADVTFSWSSLRRYQHTAIEFVKWAHDKHGIKQIREVTTAMVVAYIDSRRARNLSPRTIATDITGLRRFGMYLVLEGWHKQNCVPDDLSEPHGSNPRYSYAPEHADQVIDSVAKHDPLAADVLRWQLACGLRISEAVRLRLESARSGVAGTARSDAALSPAARQCDQSEAAY